MVSIPKERGGRGGKSEGKERITPDRHSGLKGNRNSRTNITQTGCFQLVGKERGGKKLIAIVGDSGMIGSVYGLDEGGRPVWQ